MFPSRALPRHGIFLKRQARLLARHGIDSTFVVPRPRAPWPLTVIPRWALYGPGNSLLTDGNPPVHSLRYSRPPGHWFRRWEGWVLSRSLIACATRLHTQEPFDAILACPMIPDAVAARSVKAKLKLPLITLAIGSDILVYPRKMPGLAKQLRDTLASTDLAVGVSRAVCSRLTDLGARDPLCVYLGREAGCFTPAADKTALRQEFGLPAHAVVAVTVGGLVSSKGIHELVQAVRGLGHFPHFRLLCVGDGPGRASLASLGTACVMAGERTPEEVAGYLQAADFLVHPSHSEGMPQAVLEAMSCGLPVVATSVGGVAEAVRDGDNGLLVPPQDAQALRKAMERMITNPIFREQAGQRSLSVVAGRFDGEANAIKMALAIKSLPSVEAGAL